MKYGPWIKRTQDEIDNGVAPDVDGMVQVKIDGNLGAGHIRDTAEWYWPDCGSCTITHYRVAIKKPKWIKTTDPSDIPEGAEIKYRRPEPIDIELPWDAIDDKYQWAARDDDGVVWVYSDKPTAGAAYWSHLPAGHVSVRALKHKPGNRPWKESLIKRP